jgi:hypothetical protein
MLSNPGASSDGNTSSIAAVQPDSTLSETPNSNAAVADAAEITIVTETVSHDLELPFGTGTTGTTEDQSAETGFYKQVQGVTCGRFGAAMSFTGSLIGVDSNKTSNGMGTANDVFDCLDVEKDNVQQNEPDTVTLDSHNSITRRVEDRRTTVETTDPILVHAYHAPTLAPNVNSNNAPTDESQRFKRMCCIVLICAVVTVLLVAATSVVTTLYVMSPNEAPSKQKKIPGTFEPSVSPTSSATTEKVKIQITPMPSLAPLPSSPPNPSPRGRPTPWVNTGNRG